MTLTEYLSTNNLTQSAFAERIGVSSEAVNQWVKGKRFPRPESIMDIERETGGKVRVADWYTFAPAPTQESAA
jgi:DNA-binding transcriptional regulator YdaS (Cro superfamily)